MRAVIALLVASLLLVVGAAQTDATPIIAIQDDQLTTPGPEGDFADRAALVAETGARWTRVDVLWRNVAPTRPERPADPLDPAYRWAQLDTALRELDRNSVRALFAVYHSPSWATPGRDDPAWVPDRDQYAAFMVALGRRYSGRFEAGLQPAPGPPLPKVAHFEIWNEPNLDLFLRPQWREVNGRLSPASPALYAGLVTAVHPRLLRARPDATIIIGALGPTNQTNPPGGPDDAPGFTGIVGIKDFIPALARQKIPAMAVSQHIYPRPEPGASGALPTIQGLPRILDLWDGVAEDLPIYITETGYTTLPKAVRPFFVDEETQADYLPRLLEGLDQPRVEMIVWYHLQDNAQWASGLLTVDGRKKPSWDAFRAAVGD